MKQLFGTTEAPTPPEGSARFLQLFRMDNGALQFAIRNSKGEINDYTLSYEETLRLRKVLETHG